MKLTMKDVAQSSLFKPEVADALAADMNAEDEYFTYVVRHDPKGKGLSLIDIYDEDNYLIGQL